jgi:hypothetical protein
LGLWGLLLTDGSASFGSRVVAGAAATADGHFTTLAQVRDTAWTFSAIHTHISDIYMNNDRFIRLKDNVGGAQYALGMSPTNEMLVGNPGFRLSLASLPSDLFFNSAQLNTPLGLTQVGASGKLSPSLMPFSTLEFIGTWDASGGTNPPDGPAAPTQGGQFYVINIAGNLTVFVDDTGIPVLTAVNPGDYLLWISGAGSSLTPGWYHVVRETPVFVDASNVTYDNSGSGWVATLVQDVLDEIWVRVPLNDTAESISAIWSFTAGLSGNLTGNVIGDVTGNLTGVASGNLVTADLAPYTQRAVGETIAGQWVFSLFTRHNGGAVLSNNIPLWGRNVADDTSYELAYVSTTPVAVFGSALIPSILRGESFIQLEVSGSVVATAFPAVDGGLFVRDRNNLDRLAGFRNPRLQTLNGPYTPVQADEGTVIQATTGIALTLDSLEAFTTMRLVTRAGAAVNTITAGTAAVTFFDGDAGGDTTFNVAPNSIVELYWASATSVFIFGNGISL